MRERILKCLLKKVPDGDLWDWSPNSVFKISCVFVFWKRIDLMKNILHCLASQNFCKESFEVILVEDKGGSEEGRRLKEDFNQLMISYFAPRNHCGRMGYMRNYGLSKAKGEVILFLDDDTVILDRSFFAKLDRLFNQDENLTAIIPKGCASYCVIKNRYAFHDPYFFTNRCMAYRRACLIALRGFDSGFIGQEDVELAIRFLSNGFKHIKAKELEYYHPPLVVHNLRKPMAVGLSFVHSKYSVGVKFLLLMNGVRWLPRYFLPGSKNRYLGRFALGFALGFFKGIYSNDNGLTYS